MDYRMKYFLEGTSLVDSLNYPNFDTVEECMDYADSLYDEGKSDDDFTVYNTHNESVAYIRYSDRRKLECPLCEKMHRRDDMVWSHDCHGIPYRLVCMNCYDKILDSEEGYDGEYYDECDENLDYDY